MVTSTSTPSWILMEVICLIISDGVQINDALVDAHLEAVPGLWQPKFIFKVPLQLFLMNLTCSTQTPDKTNKKIWSLLC